MKGGYLKAIVHEMLVKCKGFHDLSRLHDFKTETIHKANISSVLGQKALHGPAMPFGICPYYFQEGDDLCIEIIN